MLISLHDAARRIHSGEIVAFPTETVYGIGANAFNAQAIQKIYAIKGRPSSNPIIIHIGKKEDVHLVAQSIDPISQKLINTFWPGPLTLILPKHPSVPQETCANLPTVAVRMPNHPIAQQLITLAKTPIAAPSANPSGKPSATHHSHVEKYFKNDLPVIAGNETKHGIESTVIMVKNNIPHILRLGSITEENIKKATEINPIIETASVHSPGTQFRHYAPKAKLIVVTPEHIAKAITAIPPSKSMGILALDKYIPFIQQLAQPPTSHTLVFSLGSSIKTAAQQLYSGLIALDAQNVDIIVTHTFPNIGLGKALNDRITRAAQK